MIGVAREYRKPSVQIEVTGEGFDPLTLVQVAVRRKDELLGAARKQKNSFDKNFELWVVFDTDDFPQIEAARRLAIEANIGLAQSNPCFEVWGIYHFRDHHAPDDSRQCQRMLSKLCGHYDHNGRKLFQFERLSSDSDERRELLDKACDRAHSGLTRREEEGAPNGRPSSEVVKIVDVIKSS